MQLTRREVLRMAGMAAMAAPFSGFAPPAGGQDRRLFFLPDDLPRIRANAAGDFLGPTFEAWRSVPSVDALATIERVLESHDYLGDLGQSVETIFREATMLLVTGDVRHEDLVLRGLEVLQEIPAWDYLLEADEHILGLMRASKATTCVLFAMEVLGDRIDAARRDSLLSDVADKGCAPCALTLHNMDHPDEVVGWGVDVHQRERYGYDMSRWPTILGRNNLRAIPTMGLGMGALALEGRDPRASAWLDQAVSSAKTFLDLFEDDGSYFEGISYVDFAFRTMLMFLEAHYRIHGDVDWIAAANFRGITEYIVCLQNGRKDDGTPDVINISDARNSVFPCVPSWIAMRNGDPLAQYAATHMSNPGFYSDFLWYDATRPENPPPDSLLNKRFDLDWIVTRTGWSPDDAVVAFRSGPPMNHEHADRNSIMVKAYGERLLTDPFGASYDRRQSHWLLRKTEAHNAALVDGKGHRYVDGSEGTNAGMAFATILTYEDLGDVVSWTSDATQAYRLDRPDVGRILRSVLFVKPGVLVLVDRLEMESGSAQLSIRLQPDNRDGSAFLKIKEPSGFGIVRPRATVLGATGGSARISMSTLDLQDSFGVYPYLEIAASLAKEATIVTALSIQPSSSDRSGTPVVRLDDGLWRIVAGDVSIAIDQADDVPRFRVT